MLRERACSVRCVCSSGQQRIQHDYAPRLIETRRASCIRLNFSA